MDERVTAAELWAIAEAAKQYVEYEIADDPAQDEPGCALWPLIQALRAADLLPPKRASE